MPSAAAPAQMALVYTDAWNTSSTAIAIVENDGARITIASAATNATSAMKVSVCAARNALTIDACASFSLGVRRNALWNRMRPRTHASVTTQLNANHTCNPATESPQLHRTFSFIAHTARSRPDARNAIGSP